LSNYTLPTTASGPGHITPATLTYVAAPKSRTYGAPNPAFTGTVTGFVNGESLGSATTGALTFSSPANASSSVGSYPINGSGLTANNGNYTFVQDPGNATALTITQATLTVTPSNISKVYGTVATLTGTITGQKNGETFTATYVSDGAAATAPVSGNPYLITVGTVTGPTIANYTLVKNTGTLTVTTAQLTIKANNISKEYGTIYAFDTTTPSTDFSVTGLVGSDTVTSVTLTSTGAAGTALAGQYLITPSAALGTGLSNYTIIYINGTLTIFQREGRVAYIGQTLFVTSGASATTAQVTLTASVVDPDTSSLGSVGNATVTFTDLLTGKVLASGVKVTPVANSGTNTGTANTIVTLSTGQYGSQEYLIEVKLDGSYTNSQQTGAPAGSDPYNAAHPVVTVMIPATKNTMQGSGTNITAAAPAGLYGLGAFRSYTAGMAYNNKGTNTQGHIELIIDLPDGAYYIKSNSITSVAFSNPVGGVNKDVTVYTKASIYKIDLTGKTISIDGAVTLRMDAHDGGIYGDTIGFTVLSSKDGTLYYSNDWVWDDTILGYRTVQQPVVTGTSGAAVQIN
jgi:hypothetical protein